MTRRDDGSGNENTESDLHGRKVATDAALTDAPETNRHPFPIVECLPFSQIDALPSDMPASDDRLELLQGTLDMLILKTLLFGPAHGHGIGTYIRQTTSNALVVEHGSLYPALHRLQRDGFITAKWDKAPDKNRELKYYRLTPAGRRQLAAQQSRWDELVRAIGCVMKPMPET
jgi:transcriptional regulator